MLRAMPETADLLLGRMELLHQRAVHARTRGDFAGAMEHNKVALAALPADGTLTGAAHNEWLARFVSERANIAEAAARHRRAVDHEQALAAMERRWAEQSHWSAQRMASAVRQVRILKIGAVVVCCLALALVEVTVRLVAS